MWQRIKLIFKSWIRKFWLWRESPEPEDVLRKYIQHNSNKILELNKQIADIIKHEKLLELQYIAKQNDIIEIKKRIEEVVLMGNEKKTEAKELIVYKKTLEKEAENLRKQYIDAQEYTNRALKIRRIYANKTQNKTQELQVKLNQLNISHNIKKTNNFIEEVFCELDKEETETFNLNI
jgi:phage shock protein A